MKMSHEDMENLDDQTIRDVQILSNAATRWTKNMIDDLLQSGFLVKEVEQDTGMVPPSKKIFATANPRTSELGVELNITIKTNRQCSHLTPVPLSLIEEAIPVSAQKQIVDSASSTNEDFSGEDEGPIDLSPPPTFLPLTPPSTPIDHSDAISTTEDIADL